MDYPHIFHEKTHHLWHMFDALPGDNGGRPARITGSPQGRTFFLRRGLS